MSIKNLLLFAPFLVFTTDAFAQNLSNLKYNANLPVKEITRLLPIYETVVHLYNGAALTYKDWEDHLYIELRAYSAGSDTQRFYLFRKEGNEYDSLMKHLFLKKLCGNDSICIYRFGETSPHTYWYLLLKENDRYRILNCDDFLDDFNEISELLCKIKNEISYDNMYSIIMNYSRNENYHPTPPRPDLSGINTGAKSKSYYDPRVLVETSPFYFVSDAKR